MGCDIHSLVEVGWELRDGKVEWEAVTDAIFENPFYLSDQGISLYNVPFTHKPLRRRNYKLFAKLADVRNGGSSFFTVPDELYGDPIEPLADPRGVPEDASREWKSYTEDPDIHSETYFTLKELEEFYAQGKLDDEITERGWVNREQYLDLRESGKEPNWWANTVGGRVEKYPIEDAEKLTIEEIKAIDIPGPAHPSALYFGAEWTRKLDSTSAYFELVDTMQKMATRLGAHDFDKIRLMVGFDN